MRVLVIFFISFLLSGCGSYFNELTAGKKDKERNCHTTVPLETQQAMDRALKDNHARKMDSIDSFINDNSLEMIPLHYQFEELISDRMAHFIPSEDPYPESIVAVGEEEDVREFGYEINHGKMGMERIYETSPGSRKYFIVDIIEGDGMGGNSFDIAGETVEYDFLMMKRPMNYYSENSYHSWYVNENNQAVRMQIITDLELKESIRICGCRPGTYMTSNYGQAMSDSIAPEPIDYRIGIFMLPYDILPEMLPLELGEVHYKSEYFQKEYIPEEGKRCQEPNVVC